MERVDSLPASLYQIESAIVELFLMLDEAEAEGDAKQVEVIQGEIDKWTAAELRKVDGVVSWIKECEARAEIASEEAKRQKYRAEMWQAKADRVKAAALRAMQEHGVKAPLQGRHHVLRIQGNGGLQPLETGDALPTEYRLVTVTMREPEWSKIADQISYAVDMTVKPDNYEIRKALKMQAICPECKGAMRFTVCDCEGGSNPEWHDCPRCEGKGTVPNTVPGARLKERGVTLRIS